MSDPYEEAEERARVDGGSLRAAAWSGPDEEEDEEREMDEEDEEEGEEEMSKSSTTASYQLSTRNTTRTRMVSR